MEVYNIIEVNLNIVYKDMEDAILSFLAAGVPSNQIAVEMPELVYNEKHNNYKITGRIHFKK